MPGDDRCVVEVQSLQFLQGLWILDDIGLGHVAQLLLQDGTGIQDALIGEVDKGIARPMGWSQEKKPYGALMEYLDASSTAEGHKTRSMAADARRRDAHVSRRCVYFKAA